MDICEPPNPRRVLFVKMELKRFWRKLENGNSNRGRFLCKWNKWDCLNFFRVYILSTQTLVWNWFYFAWYWHDTGSAKFCYFFYQWPFTVSDWIKRTHPMESDQCRDLATNRWSLKNIYITITNILTSYARLDKSNLNRNKSYRYDASYEYS